MAHQCNMVGNEIITVVGDSMCVYTEMTSSFLKLSSQSFSLHSENTVKFTSLLNNAFTPYFWRFMNQVV